MGLGIESAVIAETSIVRYGYHLLTNDETHSFYIRNVIRNRGKDCIGKLYCSVGNVGISVYSL